jgi:hypothetical protein
MELAAIIIGLALRRWHLPQQQNDTIYTDCRSITDVINGTTPKLSKFPAKIPFLQGVLHHLKALKPQGVTLQWTKAHPETRTTPDKYTDQDWGIYLADCAASNHPILPQITIAHHLQLSLPDILCQSMDPLTWFTSLPNGLPRISSPIILRRDADTLNYLARKQRISGLSLTMLNSIWKLKKQSHARRSTIMKIITGWNVDGSRYSLYTTDPRDKAKNAHCPLCMAIDSDFHWICDCPCPALLQPRETLLQHTIPQLIRDTLATVGTQHPTILPQTQELCRAIQHSLLHHPQREQLWKGAWTTELITSLAYNARAHARSRPWQSPAAKAQLTTILKSIGTLTTAYTLNAWKHRRRAAIQIHQQIQRHANPTLFDHTPRLPHMDKIKYSDPILTESQLQDTLHRLLRLNPTRPNATRRTFGRRRAHQQQTPQPPPPQLHHHHPT